MWGYISQPVIIFHGLQVNDMGGAGRNGAQRCTIIDGWEKRYGCSEILIFFASAHYAQLQAD